MINVGIGLPSTVPGASRESVIKWACAAENGPFSSLGMVDKICYLSHDTMISMAFAAAVTERLNLMVTVMVAALREPILLAKQAATIDVLSGGRFILGVGAGELLSASDYAAIWPGRDYAKRGKHLEDVLDTVRGVWRGEIVMPEGLRVGPTPLQPGGPPILIGAGTPIGIRRVGRYGDGYIGSGHEPALDRAKPMADLAIQHWRESGRSGKPLLKKAVHYALGGPESIEKAVKYFNDIYRIYIDDDDEAGYTQERWIKGLVHSPEMVKDTISAFEEAGYDEVVFWPTIGEFEQLERLAEIVA